MFSSCDILWQAKYGIWNIYSSRYISWMRSFSVPDFKGEEIYLIKSNEENVKSLALHLSFSGQNMNAANEPVCTSWNVLLKLSIIVLVTKIAFWTFHTQE